MSKLFLYNTLTRRQEEFKSLFKKTVGLYSCGPTVYNYAHLGNLRAYLFVDILKRALVYNGYQVKHVMNITDVGHLVGDGDMGEDKFERQARVEKKDAWDIARFYEEAFKKDLAALNIITPSLYARVTDNIPEQIALIKTLEKKGFVYRTSDGLYFDTALVKDYNKLSHLPLEKLREGARVEKNEEKKNPTDFALWKFSPTGAKRQMEWPSPWGVGFPGWHIECSAISLKYLGKQLDIHCGGSDHINVHHTNEIAQSEAATGKKFFNYWLHNAFLNIAGGKKMAKSAGNFLTLDKAVLKKGIDPLAYRFAFLQGSYRKPMEYSEDSLRRADEGLKNLKKSFNSLGLQIGKIDKTFKEKFLTAINKDLNTAQALAVLAQVLKSKLKPADKRATVLDFDRVLGLKLDETVGLDEANLEISDLPTDLQKILTIRQQARLDRNFKEADRLREVLKDKGYLIEDSNTGVKISRLK
mgnify:CR=1 FL=1